MKSLTKNKRFREKYGFEKPKDLKSRIKIWIERVFFLEFLHLHIKKQHPKPHVRFLKTFFGNRDLIGCEIGIYKGENSEQLLKNLNIQKLYLIDPYIEYKDYDIENEFTIQIPFKKIEPVAHKKLSRYKDKIIFIKEKSSDALSKIPSNLDFVYIDGNHAYKFVKEDIENYYKKIRKGGILSGHDIDHPEIARAVIEFIQKEKINNFQVDFQDWWIKKK